MGFMILIIGMAGIADAIVLETDPTIAIVATIIGFLLFARDYKKYLEEQNRR